MEFALWRDARLWAVPRGAPQFFIADQDVCAAGIQINAHHVPRLHKGKSATRGRLWRGVQIEGNQMS